KKQTVQTVVEGRANGVPKSRSLRGQTVEHLRAQCGLAHSTRPAQGNTFAAAQRSRGLLNCRFIADHHGARWMLRAQRWVQISEQRLTQMLHGNVKVAVMLGA